MVDPVVGLFGGAAASVAAVLVFAFDDSVPFPASLVVARVLGTTDSDPDERYYVGLAGTFAYGLPAGVAYVALFSRVPLLSVTSFPGGVVYGVVWGVALAGLLALLAGDRIAAGYGRYLLASNLLYGFVLAGFVVMGPTDPTATPGPAGAY